MATPSQKLIVGNWKMNGQLQNANTLITAVGDYVRSHKSPCSIVICPPFTLLTSLSGPCRNYEFGLGAQDCHEKPCGAFTGDISAPMLKEAGCRYVVVGHSERRQYHQESDTIIRAKAEAAIAEGLTPIICIGETESEYNHGKTLETIEQQLNACLPLSPNLILAYEPVWAIGSGKTPSLEEIRQVHQFIDKILRKAFEKPVRILYGGSAKPQNAKEILAIPHVDGLLVGGASLEAQCFTAIIEAASAYSGLLNQASS